MPRFRLKRRGAYAPSGRSRTPSPGPRGNYRLSTAISILPPGRIAQELQKLTHIKKKKTRDRKLAAAKVDLTRNRQKLDSASSLDASGLVTGSRGRSRSRTRTTVTAVKGRSRSRSRSNTRINVVSVKTAAKKKGRGSRLTKKFSCVAARSRSCTPERNHGLRVQPVQMPSAKPDGPVPLKGTGLFIFQDKENLNPQVTSKSVKSDAKGGSKLRMWNSLRKKVKGAVEKSKPAERSCSVKQSERPPRPEPRLRHTSCSSCSCSRDTSSSTCSSSDKASVFSHLSSMSPPNLPPVTSARLRADKANNNDTNLYSTCIQNRPLPPPPVPKDAFLNRRPSLPSKRRPALTSVSSSSSSGSTGGLSSGYGSLPRFPRPPPPPPRLPPPRGKVTHVRTIKMDKFMTHKWVTGVAFGRKGDLVVVDLRDCYVVDAEDGSLKRQVNRLSLEEKNLPIFTK